MDDDDEMFVTRWVIHLDDGRYVMYDDQTHIEESDEVLEIRLPTSMAYMLDHTQDAFYNMQGYMHAQWMLMHEKLAMDAGETPIYDMVEQPMDGDSRAFEEKFMSIIRNNNLEVTDEETD